MSHVTLAVSNLERSFHFYVEQVGLKPLVRWDEGSYLLAGGLWIGLLSDRAAPEATNNSSYTHLAFAVPPKEFTALRDRLIAAGAEEWQPNSSPGESFYFLDPDGHKLEIHARTVHDRLAWLRQNPKPGIDWFT